MWKRILATTAFTAALTALAATMVPKESNAFDLTGGSAWQSREGPGVGFGVGFNGCGDGLCQRDWGTGTSIGSVIGFHYRFIPNLVFFGELHTGHIPVNYDMRGVDKDNGFVFEMTGGAEFHLPLTGWVAPYVGLGMGFIYLGAWAETDALDVHERFTGFDFQFRTGADFFPFAKVPNLSIGPVILISAPAWARGCSETNGEERCREAKTYVGEYYTGNRRDDLPNPYFFGGLAKLWF